MIGRTISHYEIVEKIGEGGMGVVYRARDTHLDRSVAIKVLPPDKVTDSERKRRFVQEAKAASALNHPNIVHIYDIDQQDGADYIAMEYVEGKTLGELITRKGLKLSEALRYAIQIADALAGAHSVGIVHRDLKPGNVMVTGPASGTPGHVKLLDFGLAKLMEPTLGPEDETRTAQQPTGLGLVIGTAAYMSPEQAAAKNVDARSDIFSFGSVLYEMLTGRRAFGRDTPALTIAAVLQAEPPPLPAEIPQEMERVVGRCMRKDPARRFQTMADLKVTLEELKEESESGTLAPAPAARAKSRAPWPWVAATVAGLLLAALLFWRSRAGTSPPSSAPLIGELQITQLTSTGNAGSPAISPDGKYVAYVQEERGVSSLWIRQIDTASQVQIARAEPGTEIGSPTIEPDGAFVDFVRANAFDNAEVWRIPFLGGTPKKLLDTYVSQVGWSPEGRRMAFVRGGDAASNDSLIIANADGSQERRIATLRHVLDLGFSRPSWSADGRLLAVRAFSGVVFADQVVVVDSGSGAARTLQVGLAFRGSGPEWLDPGSLVLSGAADSGGLSQLWRLSYPGGQLARLTNDLTHYVGVSLTADRSSLVTGRGEVRQSIWVGDRSGAGGAEMVPLSPAPNGSGLAWARQRLLYVTMANGRPSIAYVTGGEGSGEVVTKGHMPAATSDGRTIVFVSLEKDDRRGLWKVDAEGRHAVQLVADMAVNPVLTPDDRRVIFVSVHNGKQRLWSVSIDGGPVAPLGDMFAYSPDVSPDGKSLLFGASSPSGGSELTIRDLPDCASLRKVTTPPGGAVSRWTPDGKGIAYYDDAPGGNLWVQPLDGSPRKQLTHFKDKLSIEDFKWSRDGTRLAILRTVSTSDIVLLKGLRR